MKMDLSLIRVDVSNEYLVVYFLAADINDSSQVLKVAAEITEAAERFSAKRMVINFSGLKHLTSAFLARLIALKQRLKELGMELRLCCMSAELDHAFRLCKLHRMIKLFSTEDEALA